jgi:sulfur relay (sulfurtransferase) DsrC/TusE family protein
MNSEAVIQVTMTEWNVLTFMRNFSFRYGRMPRQSEIARGCGMKNRNRPRQLLIQLNRKGLVVYEWGTGKRVSLRLTNTCVAVQP